MVTQLFCVKTPVDDETSQSEAPFRIANPSVDCNSRLVTIILSLSLPLPKSKILSNKVAFPVNLTTATAVKPPWLAILNLNAPPSTCCSFVRLKFSAPRPETPASGTNTGRAITLLRTHTHIPPSDEMGGVVQPPAPAEFSAYNMRSPVLVFVFPMP